MLTVINKKSFLNPVPVQHHHRASVWVLQWHGVHGQRSRPVSIHYVLAGSALLPDCSQTKWVTLTLIRTRIELFFERHVVHHCALCPSSQWSWVHSGCWAPRQPSWRTPACYQSRLLSLSRRLSPLPPWTTPYWPQLRTVCHRCEGANSIYSAETEETGIQCRLLQMIHLKGGGDEERLRCHPPSEAMLNKSFTFKLIVCCKRNVSKGGLKKNDKEEILEHRFYK